MGTPKVTQQSIPVFQYPSLVLERFSASCYNLISLLHHDQDIPLQSYLLYIKISSLSSASSCLDLGISGCSISDLSLLVRFLVVLLWSLLQSIVGLYLLSCPKQQSNSCFTKTRAKQKFYLVYPAVSFKVKFLISKDDLFSDWILSDLQIPP